jgi:hypothetical protein
LGGYSCVCLEADHQNHADKLADVGYSCRVVFAIRILLIAIGVVVLLLGKRLAMLGAAVGALLGLRLLRFFPGSSSVWVQFVVPISLAVIGFFAAGFAKGIVNIVLMVIGALAGAALVMGVFDLFGMTSTLMELLLAVLGGLLGIVLINRFKDLAMILLAGLIGGLLVTRGLTIWLPFLQGWLGTLIVLVLAGIGIAYQSGFSGKRSPAAIQ